MYYQRLKNAQGFTIIEIMIVLAVAGLILVVVLLAVPNAKRIERNDERREIVGEVFSDVGQFVTTHGYYPRTPADYCTFYNESVLKDKSPSAQPCNAVLVPVGDCVFVQGKRFTLCYHDRFSTHDYVGPYDQINIEHAHWCGTDPTNVDEYPITDGGTGDNRLTDYVVWTPLEPSGFACASSQ